MPELDSQQCNSSITCIFTALPVLLLLYIIFITVVSQIPRLQIILINRQTSQHIPDTFIVVVRNDSGFMVLPDPSHISNHYKFITTSCSEVCSQLRGERRPLQQSYSWQCASIILFYLESSMACSIIFIWWINTMIFVVPMAKYGIWWLTWHIFQDS